MSEYAATETMEYPPSELIIDHGKIYHLDLRPEMVADKVILVGDPDRVAIVASYFDSIESQTNHREFTSRTGTFQGKRITVLSTGIGVGNIDITLNELDALVNIDFTHRKHKESTRSLEIVRIGTCGLLQADIPIHSFVVSAYAVGLDNIAHFYDCNFSPEELSINAAVMAHLELPAQISTYAIQATPSLVHRLRSQGETVSGITITSPGFYGPQGRQLRLKTHTSELNHRLGSFRYNLSVDDTADSTSAVSSTTSEGESNAIDLPLRILNFEMESSALFALGRSLGHQCCSVCLAIANRPALKFSDDYTPHMKRLIEFVLARI